MESEPFDGPEGDNAALSSRLEALLEQAATADGPELPVGPVVAASLTGLRSDLAGLRSDVSRLLEDRQGGVDSAEERLAAIEDTLDGLAERLEALARDSATDAGERIASLDDRLAALSQSVSAERTAAAQHRERSAVAMQDQAAALDEWAEAVRAGLEELGEAVTSSLGSLGSTLQNPGARDHERRHLEALLTELTTTVDEAFVAMSEQLVATQLPIEAKLASVHEDVLDGFGGARARLIEELSGVIGRLEQANHSTRQTVETELVVLRGDLADALEEVRERVEATVNDADESISAALADHRASSEELRDSFSTAASHAQDSNKRVRGLQDAVSRMDTTVADLQGEWRPRVDAVVAEGRASAQSVLAEVRAEIDKAMSEMSEMLAAQATALRDVTGLLGGGTERLVGAGQALLAYLADRDRWLEAERDRVLHEVLDEFAEGLSAKERKAVSSRVAEALDRRRDARDAHRYRRTQQGQPAVEIPAVPEEIAELDEPVVPVVPSARRTRPAPTGASSPPVSRSATRRSTSARPVKTAAKKATPSASKSTAKSTPRKAVSKTTSRGASTAKSASKSTKKAASKSTTPPPGTDS